MRPHIPATILLCFTLLLPLIVPATPALAAPAVGSRAEAVAAGSEGAAVSVTPSVPALWHTIAKGDTLWLISRIYDVSVVELSRLNGNPDPDNLLLGMRLLIRPAGTLSRALYAWPVSGIITSLFGMRHGHLHTGLDIGVGYGTGIVAARAGLVVAAAWLGNYGRAVLLDHGDGVNTLYAHASKLLVKVGEWVSSGETIAKVGTSGNSTGPHVHFEVRVAGKTIDPLRVLR